MCNRSTDLSVLRYIRAARLDSGSGNLEGFEVRNPIGARLGRFSGLLIDPATARVRYLVVSSWLGVASDVGVLPLVGARLLARERVLVVFDHTSLSAC
jgi:hypothetical protein